MNPTTTNYKNLDDLKTVRLFKLIGIPGTDAEEQLVANQFANGVWNEYWYQNKMAEVPAEAFDDMEDLLKNEELTEKEQSKGIMELMKKYGHHVEEEFLTKLLELKANLFVERVEGLREFYKSQPETLAKVTKALDLIKDGKWTDAVELINSFTLKG